MKTLHVITILTFVLIVYINEALSDGWEWFQICRHQDGRPPSKFIYLGLETKGWAWINTELIVTVVPLKTPNCVFITFDDGGHLTIVGTVETIWCKIKGGPLCGEGGPE